MATNSKRVIAYVADLMFSSRIQETLKPAGFVVEAVEDLASLSGALDRAQPDAIILDLDASAKANDVLARAGGVPVLAFGRHTEPALLRSAREAGCALVVPRSLFVEEMPDLILRAIGAHRPA